MGNTKMKCLGCGTTDINNFLVTFNWNNKVEDTTTLPKFLYYLKYVNDRQKGFYEPVGKVPAKIKKIYCGSCREQKEVKPTRYGI